MFNLFFLFDKCIRDYLFILYVIIIWITPITCFKFTCTGVIISFGPPYYYIHHPVKFKNVHQIIHKVVFFWLFMTFLVLKISAYQLCRDKDQLPAAWRQAVPRTRMHEHTIHTITVAHFTTHPNLMLYFYYKTKIITSSTGMSVMIGSFTAGYCFN